jgi:uncharacterized membrane protein
MLNIKTALILVAAVIGIGSTMGFEANSDYVIASIISFVAAPFVTPWFN